MMIRLRWLILTWENRGGKFPPVEAAVHGGDGKIVAVSGGGGIIEFRPFIPTSATGFIEINYSPRPHAYGSEIAAILARWRPGQQPQQPEERAGGQTKEGTARALMLSPPLLCYD